MKTSVKLFGLFASVLPLFCGAQSSKGLPAFGDDFSTYATFAEKWTAKGKINAQNGVLEILGGSAAIRHKLPEEYVLSFDLSDLKDIKPDQKGGFITVSLDKDVLILLRKQGNCQLLIPMPHDQKRRTGAGKNVDMSRKPNKIEIVRQKGSGVSYSYTMTINGTRIGQVFATAKPEPTISFGNWRVSGKIDNVEVCALKKEGMSPNLVLNSSLEYLQEEFNPEYFVIGLNRVLKENSKFEDFAAALNSDSAVKHSGKRSFRLTNVPGLITGTHIYTSDVGISVGQPVTFSVYLKASKPGTEAELVIREMWGAFYRKRIKVGTDWQRFSQTATPKTVLVRCGVTNLSKDASVWADDFQAEVDPKMTKYLPCQQDKTKFGGEKVVYPKPQNVTAKLFTSAPALGGALDAKWMSGTKVSAFYVKGANAPKSKTEAWVGCDKENLYIGVRACFKNLNKVKAVPNTIESPAATSDDCIEFFFDRGRTLKNSYQFCSNAVQARFDSHQDFGISWNGEWKVSTAKNPKTGSVDYKFVIPFSDLSGANFSEVNGFNIGRNAPADTEVSDLKRIPGAAFKQPFAYPELRLPAAVVRNYALGIKSASVSRVPGSQTINLSLQIENNSGKPRKLSLDARTKSGAAGTAAFTVNPGTSTFTMPVKLAKLQGTDFIVAAVENGKKLFSAAVYAKVQKAVMIRPRFNYYMNEKEAQVLVVLDLPENAVSSIELSCGKFSKKLKYAKRQFVMVPISALPNGKTPIRLKISGKISCTEQAFLEKKPYFKGATQIDRIRRCVYHDGKPMLIMAPLWVFSVPLTDRNEKGVRNTLAYLKRAGFSELITLAGGRQFGDNKTQKYVKYLKLCGEYGFNCIVWNSMTSDSMGRRGQENFDPAPIIKALTLPNTITHLIFDEPEIQNYDPKLVSAAVDKCRAASPYHPVAINYTVLGVPGRYAGLNNDIPGLDDYITNSERNVESVLLHVRRAADCGIEEGKPCFFFTSGWVYGNHYRAPRYNEQIAIAYGAVAAGATGLEYFYGVPFPVNPGNWKGMKQVAAEFKQLAPIVCSPEECDNASVSDSAVKYITRQHKGYLYVIAVDTETRPAENVRIMLPGSLKYSGNVEVLFENRKIELKGGAFTDRFDMYSRHVYRIKLK